MHLGGDIWALSVMLNLSGLLFQEEESVAILFFFFNVVIIKIKSNKMSRSACIILDS